MQAVKEVSGRVIGGGHQPGPQAATQPKHASVSPFTAKSPHGQLQALEHMFDSLPERQPKGLHSSPGGPEYHPKGNAGQDAFRGPIPARQGTHSFRLSFSPTGIPAVEPLHDADLETQQHVAQTAHGASQPDCGATTARNSTDVREHSAVKAEANCVRPENASARAEDTADDHKADAASSAGSQPSKCQVASGTGTSDHKRTAAAALPVTSPQASASAADGNSPAAAPTAISEAQVMGLSEAHAVGSPIQRSELTALPNMPGSTDGAALASAGTAERGRSAKPKYAFSPPLQGRNVQLPSTEEHSEMRNSHVEKAGQSGVAGAAHSATRAAAMDSPDTSNLLADQLNHCRALPAVPEVQTPTADPAQRLDASQASSLSYSQSASSLSHPSQSLLPPSTPMLAWLNALGTPGSAPALTQTPLPSIASIPLSLPAPSAPLAHQASAKLSGYTAPPVAVGTSLSAARTGSQSDAHHALLQAGPGVSLTAASAPPAQVTAAGSTEMTPDTLPNSASSGAVPKEATPGSLPRQAGSLLGKTTTKPMLNQATPDVRPKQATPAMGLPTGLSGLTTPPSAAEMHRYACVTP